jgi:hypothetical protein
MVEEVVVAIKGEEPREAESRERGVGVTREVSVIGVAEGLVEQPIALMYEIFVFLDAENKAVLLVLVCTRD